MQISLLINFLDISFANIFYVHLFIMVCVCVLWAVTELLWSVCVEVRRQLAGATALSFYHVGQG